MAGATRGRQVTPEPSGFAAGRAAAAACARRAEADTHQTARELGRTVGRTPEDAPRSVLEKYQRENPTRQGR